MLINTRCVWRKNNLLGYNGQQGSSYSPSAHVKPQKELQKYKNVCVLAQKQFQKHKNARVLAQKELQKYKNARVLAQKELQKHKDARVLV